MNSFSKKEYQDGKECNRYKLCEVLIVISQNYFE